MSPLFEESSRPFGAQPPLRDSAPGLSTELIDKALKDAWVEGYWAGSNAARGEALEEGRQLGQRQERQRVSEQIRRVIGGQLTHTSRKLGLDFNSKRKKTTIDAERERASQMAQEIDLAIASLEAIA